VVFGGLFFSHWEEGVFMLSFVNRMFAYGAFCATVLFVGAESLFAQGTGTGAATTVEFTPIVDFSSIFTTLTTTLGPLVAGALGLGLAIWGAGFVFSIIKRMAR
jgi:hypothetical protein